jgi:hypothetical protein
MHISDFDPRQYAYPFMPNDQWSDEPPMIEVSEHSVHFHGQRGPVGEVGLNGCQVDDIITFALATLQVYNKLWPCRENSIAITKLQEALMWLGERRRDREDRGVEGYDKS